MTHINPNQLPTQPSGTRLSPCRGSPVQGLLTPDIEQHLQTLLIDNRSTRQGFPPEIVEELMLLDGLLWALSEKRQRFLNTPDDADFSFGR